MKRRRRNQKKEKAIMFLSSLFVLTALTMTGLYVKEQNKVSEEEYVVDLSGLEEETKAADEAKQETKTDLPGGNSALVSSGRVTNPQVAEDEAVVYPWEMDVAVNEEASEEETETGEETSEPEELIFNEEEGLTWPVVGNILINYSMDKPVYFASLKQYKVSPAIVIQATEGQQITAAAAGRITRITKEEETGNTICMDIGSGYEVIYGQLTNMQVKEGDMVEKGTYLADVAAPTKYYSVEGPNVYFALSKEGSPMDPMGKLN